MLSKNILHLLFTILFILLSVLVVIIQAVEIPNHQNSIVDNFLTAISSDLNKDTKISKKIFTSFPDNLIFVIWQKKSNNNWNILLYDKKNINVKLLKNPFINVNPLCRVYQKRDTKNNFVVWIYKYNIGIFFVDILLPILLIVFVYLVVLLLIELLIRKKNDKFEDLWVKDYKISQGFKNNFDFTTIYNIVRLGVTIETYLTNALKIALEYFKWAKCTIYLKQGHNFIDYSTGNKLKQKNIIFPQNGNQKGKYFIPLYPYNYTELLGYLYFETNSKFYISDILFFLKWLFSERAKYIFFGQEKQKKYIKILDELLDAESNVFMLFIEVDERENISQNIKDVWSINLNKEIHQKTKFMIPNGIIFELYPFRYAIIQKTQDKNKTIQKITNWINDKENQHFRISREYGDISVTYSCGISFKNKRNIHSQTLINEAQTFYQQAINNGGDQVVGN